MVISKHRDILMNTILSEKLRSQKTMSVYYFYQNQAELGVNTESRITVASRGGFEDGKGKEYIEPTQSPC